LFKNANIKKKLKAVEKGLVSSVEDTISPINEMAEHIFTGGGKRIRPLFLLLLTERLGYKGDEDVTLAVATEYIHTATLVHDDIIDDASSRRSKETLNHRWDSSLSILFGDYIYAKAIEIINRIDNHKINTVFTKLTLDIIEGEILESNNKWNIDLTLEEYTKIIKKKTGELFAGTAAVGAVLGGINENDIRTITEGGLKLGIAFQLIDDLLDYVADEKRLGKPIFSDLREGKLTLPALLLRDDSSEGREIVETVFREKGFDSVQPEDLSEIIRKKNIPEEVKKEAVRYSDEGLDMFKAALNVEIAELEKLSKYIIQREF
jgi:octaprenyl-diphosphate synthase